MRPDYTLLCARSYFRRTLPLFIPSVVFTIIHRAVQPAGGVSVYTMRFDAAMFRTFWRYLVWAPGDDDAIIDVESGSVTPADPRHTIDAGETPGFVELFGESA